MAIPASYIVNITPRLITPGGTELEFNGLILSKDKQYSEKTQTIETRYLIPASAPVLEFTSAVAVGEYFGEESTEYTLANSYFLGYNNSLKKPKRLMIGLRADEDRPAFIIGGKYSGKLQALKAITHGAMRIIIDGVACDITEVDFSAATSYSDVAAKLQEKIRAFATTAVCDFSSRTGGFRIFTGTKSSEAAIDYPTPTDPETEAVKMAELMMLTKSKGAVISEGCDAMTPAGTMNKLKRVTENWVAFSTAYEATDDEHMGLAEWATGQGVDYLYVGWSADEKLVNAYDDDSIAVQFEENNMGAATLVYKDPKAAMLILGALGSIDWERRQGVITLAFKMQDNAEITVTEETVAAILEAKGINFVGNYATRNDAFNFLYPGTMYGAYKWIDPYINAIWLKNTLQLAIMQGLTTTGRVPYNDYGYCLIRSWIQDPIDRAKKNGVIDTGVVLSQSQKTQIAQEVGIDISTELDVYGYYLVVEDAGATARYNRTSPNVYCYYTYAGSVHRIDLTSTAVV